MNNICFKKKIKILKNNLPDISFRGVTSSKFWFDNVIIFCNWSLIDLGIECEGGGGCECTPFTTKII